MTCPGAAPDVLATAAEEGSAAPLPAPEPVPTIAIYDDLALARAGLEALLGEHGVEVLGTAPIGPVPAPTAGRSQSPDVALVASSGQGAAALAHRLGCEGRSRVLLMLDSPPDAERLLAVAATGASGAVCRRCPPERVLRAIRAVAAGAMYFECSHPQPAEEPPPSLLSARERHVAVELARGAGSEEIAAALCISPHTARTHLRNIKRKLGARTLAQAVALAITMGLVAPQPAADHGERAAAAADVL